MIVLCVVYRTMFTPGALFSVCFTEQCLLLKLCSHDCSLCGLQNNAYYWSFGLMIVLWFTEQWLLLELWSHDCSLVYRTVVTTGASQLLWLTSSTTPCTHHQVGCLLASFFIPCHVLLFFLFLLLFFLFLLLFFLFLLLFCFCFSSFFCCFSSFFYCFSSFFCCFSSFFCCF